MKRIYADYGYSDGPRDTCWWDDSCDLPSFPALKGDIKADVAIVGAGFTGLSAALHLAKAGVQVVVLDAKRVAWGASGRNGGFCCLGGGRISDAKLDAKFGKEGRLDWHSAEKNAVDLVASLLDEYDIDADVHSNGETLLAHQPKRFAGFEAKARADEENYGVSSSILTAAELPDAGMNGPFHGAITLPIGFGLNPRKYVGGLLKAATDLGVKVFERSPVRSITGKRVVTEDGNVTADAVIIATNGYSSEDMPDWLAGRYLPTQSNVIVTRPLTGDELQKAGWTSQQASYDTRNLLHYFRLMPDNRMLFGVRGGVISSPRAEAQARARANRDFERMFPDWAHVERPNAWSGFVCLARNGLPFVGEIPGMPGVFAGLAYHGNGVAMGTFTGKLLADLVQRHVPDLYPAAMQGELAKFPLGRARRLAVPVVYAGLALDDL